MQHKKHYITEIQVRMAMIFTSGRDGTGFAGPNAASPAREEAATRSEPATGVRQ